MAEKKLDEKKTIMETLKGTLLKEDSFKDQDGELLLNKVLNDAESLDGTLVKCVSSNDTLRKHFFKEVDGMWLFDVKRFHQVLTDAEFLPSSYTQYCSQIGLSCEGQSVYNRKDVVVNWPYKDCLLQGGQTKEDEKRKEIFWNEVLAPDECDQLLTPKALVEFKRVSKGDKEDLNEENLDSSSELNDHENYIVKGNNLMFLSSINHYDKYHGKIKLIYIDPPYNTEKDSFRYNDTFNHSTWLTFMKNRLTIARDLLSKEGTIFISIDIHEHAYLKVMCDEIFGRDNFVGEIVWKNATDNNPTQISLEHEYVICYAKDIKNLDSWNMPSEKGKLIQEKYEALKVEYEKANGKINPKEKNAEEAYKFIQDGLRKWINELRNTDILTGVEHYNMVDAKGVFSNSSNSSNTVNGAYKYDIPYKDTKEICKMPAKGWRWPKETYEKYLEDGDFWFGEDKNTIPKKKLRLDNAVALLKGLYIKDNRESSKYIKSLGINFDNPKPVDLLKRIIWCATQPGDTVLDFFAGSGSTGEATLIVNRETETEFNKRLEKNEVSEKDKEKECKPRNFILCEQMDYIDDVTRTRVKKILKDGETFISMNMATLGEEEKKKIMNCTSLHALKEEWETLKESNVLSYKVKDDEVEILLDDSKSNLETLKKAICTAIDNNMLYVPESEMEDKTYRISPEDQTFTKKFYGESIKTPKA